MPVSPAVSPAVRLAGSRLASSRLVRRGRLTLAALCLLLALVAALGSARTTPATRPAGTLVATVVASRDLPAGHVLRSGDLRTRRWPAALRPADTAAGPSALLGRRLAAPLARGEPVTRPRLVGADLTAGLPAGTVAVPVTLPADAAAVVHAGDHVDLLAGDEPVEANLLVLATLPAAQSQLTGTSATELIVATSREDAARIAVLATRRAFTAVLDGS